MDLSLGQFCVPFPFNIAFRKFTDIDVLSLSNNFLENTNELPGISHM